MKKLLNIGVVIFLLSILAACTDVTVHSAVAFTNIRDGNNKSYICDNFVTELTYEFTYTGTLDRWSSYLQGELTRDTNGHGTFFPNDNRAKIVGETVTFTYIITPRSAPLNIDLNSNELVSQAIIPVPKPNIIGFTSLHVDIFGRTGPSTHLDSYDPFPVIDNCP